MKIYAVEVFDYDCYSCAGFFSNPEAAEECLAYCKETEKFYSPWLWEVNVYDLLDKFEMEKSK